MTLCHGRHVYIIIKSLLDHNFLTECFYLHLAILPNITDFTNMFMLECCKL